MILQTKHKIFLASLAYRPIRLLRKLTGKEQNGQFRRKDLLWELDLDEVVDFMIYLTGGFETSLNQFIRKNLTAGMVALDIGANIGAHTLAMGAEVAPGGRAHAIEATEYAFEKLTRNIALNPKIADHITAHHCILLPPKDQADRNAPVEEIHSSWPFQSDEERHYSHQGVFKSVGSARKMSLDELCDELQLDLIKLDVDGNEWDVLCGGTTTLERFSPLIVMEVAPDYHAPGDTKSFPYIHRLLNNCGYQFYQLNGQALPKSAESLARSIPAGASINVIAVREGSRAPRFSR
jgi:FkbM family methyltransferase